MMAIQINQFKLWFDQVYDQEKQTEKRYWIKVVSCGQTVGFSLRFKFNLYSPRTIRIILTFFDRDEFVEEDYDSRRSTVNTDDYWSLQADATVSINLIKRTKPRIKINFKFNKQNI